MATRSTGEAQKPQVSNEEVGESDQALLLESELMQV